ncbi:universal stress protein [Arthrobacter sp. GCM10027362]|uniref:universal stress protein n=1 Tax=Arthrobacter sp. GCM10027362 TaxID=3273379 RepID=UPI00363CF691
MTILVAYVPRPEGRAAVDKGIELAKASGEKLLVINAGAGVGPLQSSSIADTTDIENLEAKLRSSGADAEFRQYVRGNTPAEEVLDIAEAENASLIVLGLRKRSPVGKLIMGSVAQTILLQATCPVLAVKAG